MASLRLFVAAAAVEILEVKLLFEEVRDEFREGIDGFGAKIRRFERGEGLI